MLVAAITPNNPMKFDISSLIGPGFTWGYHAYRAVRRLYLGEGDGPHGWVQIVEKTNEHESSLMELAGMTDDQLAGRKLVPDELVYDLVTIASTRTLRHQALLDPMLAGAYTKAAKLAAQTKYQAIILKLGDEHEPLARFIAFDEFRDQFLSRCQQKLGNGRKHFARVLERVSHLRSTCDTINMIGGINRYYMRYKQGKEITPPEQVGAWLSKCIFTVKMSVPNDEKDKLILTAVRNARPIMAEIHAYESAETNLKDGRKNKVRPDLPGEIVGKLIRDRFRHSFLSIYTETRLD